MIALCPGALETDMASTSHSNRFKSPIHEKAWQLDMKGVTPQRYSCFLGEWLTTINRIYFFAFVLEWNTWRKD